MKDIPKNQSEPGLLEMMTPEEASLYAMYRDAIGKPISRTQVHDLFYPLLDDGEVRASLIQKWAAVTGDRNARWLDPEYARTTAAGKVTAPPFFLLTINDSTGPSALLTQKVLNPSPYPSGNRHKFPNFRGVMQVAAEWEFHVSVSPRDQVSVTAIPSEIYWKRGKRQRLLFAIGDTEYRNQADALIARCRVTAVYLFKTPNRSQADAAR